MIRLENVKKSFSGKTVFDIPSFSLDIGFTCLSGASGCGKTTLGRIIAGLEKYDSGIIDGVVGAPTVLFQESRLLPTLTAFDNIKIICRTDDDKELARELFSRLGFNDDDIKKLPHELSGGMARRVAIIRAVVFAVGQGGNFVLLDEPFTGLDPEMREVAADILKEHLSGKTVLVITHDCEECELLGGNGVEFSKLCMPNG